MLPVSSSSAFRGAGGASNAGNTPLEEAAAVVVKLPVNFTRRPRAVSSIY